MRTPELTREVVALEVVVASVLTIVTGRALLALARGDRRSTLFVQIVFFLFFVLPLWLDLTVGPPTYTYQRGFVISQADHTTNVIYLGYLLLVPVVLRVAGGAPRFGEPPPQARALGRGVQVFAWASMLALPFVLVLTPSVSSLTQYASYVTKDAGTDTTYQIVLTAVASLAVMGAVLVLTAPNTLPPLRIATLPFLVVGIWVHGKRSIVALALLLMLYMLWTQGVLRGRRFIATAVLSGIVLAGFSYAYQTKVRRIDEGAPTRNQSAAANPLFVNFRIDYGRDAVTRQTIYAELHPDQLRVLEYRGQSVLFDLTFFVPRGLWPGKPYPYAIYATSTMFDQPVRDLGWGTTTSWLEEAIANFSWFGLLLGPLVPALVCRVGDRRHTPFSGVLTTTVASLLLILQVVAYMPVIALWVATVARRDRRAR